MGGKLEAGEDPYTACIREVAEETGLAIRTPALRAVLVVTVRSSDALWVIFVFSATAPHANVVASAEGELAWVDPAHVSSSELAPDLAVLMARILGGREVLIVREEYESETSTAPRYVRVLSS